MTCGLGMLMCLLMPMHMVTRCALQVMVMKEQVVTGRPAEAAAYFKAD